MLKSNKRINLRADAKDALKAVNELMGWEDAYKGKEKQNRREKS